VIIVREKHDIPSNREAKVVDDEALEGVAIAIRLDLRHSWQVLMVIRKGDWQMNNYTEAEMVQNVADGIKSTGSLRISTPPQG
jgi:hypothetical protein